MNTPPLLAQAFAHREGFGIAGDIPTTHNNPGDLRHAPLAQHAPEDPDGIGYFDTPEEGWDALVRQLGLYADRGFDIKTAIGTFAPPSQNNTAAYLQFVCSYARCSPNTPVAAALLIPGVEVVS